MIAALPPRGRDTTGTRVTAVWLSSWDYWRPLPDSNRCCRRERAISRIPIRKGLPRRRRSSSTVGTGLKGILLAETPSPRNRELCESRSVDLGCDLTG